MLMKQQQQQKKESSISCNRQCQSTDPSSLRENILKKYSFFVEQIEPIPVCIVILPRRMDRVSIHKDNGWHISSQRGSARQITCELLNLILQVKKNNIIFAFSLSIAS